MELRLLASELPQDDMSHRCTMQTVLSPVSEFTPRPPQILLADTLLKHSELQGIESERRESIGCVTYKNTLVTSL